MKYRLSLTLVILILFLSGCAGKREINDLALVMAVGIDKVEDKNEFEVTVEVARPADSRGQTGAPAGNTGDPIWSASATGKTLFEAIRNLANFSTRRVFWAHNFIVVVNEDIAREGLADIIDFFTRNPELRMRTWIAITPDKAKDVVSTMTGLEVIPGEALDKLYRYTKISSTSPRTELLDLKAAYLSETTQPVLSRLKLIERGVSNKKQGQAGAIKQVALEGAGIFKDDKLIGILAPDETRAMLPFIEEVDSGVIVLPCENEPDRFITAELRNQSLKVTPEYKENKPSFKVNYTIARVVIVEAGCPFSIKNKQQVRQLEEKLEDKVKTDIEKMLTKAQKEYQADFLELGQRFNNRFPAEWKGIKKDWDSTFANVSIDVNVNAEIKSGVLLFKPTRSGKN
ncbi:Ger(x)C family spore germination protein [Calidifontibacillus oryziterrae]|uniref:Ger(x)C family spore germination protein n=1 Tax=Calidifontibacillus oryziterrae TaxID=1191699 RepID=UPI0002E95EF0|nr:Ger(x)C family spore germination protein [Calidifontibacillus oryziterrae]